MSYEERIAHVRIFQEPFLKDVILAAGLENKALNYWDRKNDPAKQPNAISLVSNQRADFDKAAAFILEQIAASKAPQAHADQTTAEKLRDLKARLDEQILTQEEFEAKKKELLAL